MDTIESNIIFYSNYCTLNQENKINDLYQNVNKSVLTFTKIQNGWQKTKSGYQDDGMLKRRQLSMFNMYFDRPLLQTGLLSNPSTSTTSSNLVYFESQHFWSNNSFVSKGRKGLLQKWDRRLLILTNGLLQTLGLWF